MNEVVEEIRRRWDPATAALVAAHLTLVYEVDDDVVARLRRVAGITAPLGFVVTRAACWGSPAGGIYLAVDDSLGAIGALRRFLQVGDPPGLVYTPHVTLVHPRSATPQRAAAAWEDLSGLRLDERVTVGEVALVLHTGRGWEAAETIRLTGRPDHPQARNQGCGAATDGKLLRR